MATKFCTVVPNIWGSSVRNLRQVFLVAPRILKWLLDIWKIRAPLVKLNNVTEVNHKNNLSVWSVACKSNSRPLDNSSATTVSLEITESRTRKENSKADVITHSHLYFLLNVGQVCEKFPSRLHTVHLDALELFSTYYLKGWNKLQQLNMTIHWTTFL
jgi:hypothetical protein